MNAQPNEEYVITIHVNKNEKYETVNIPAYEINHPLEAVVVLNPSAIEGFRP